VILLNHSDPEPSPQINDQKQCLNVEFILVVIPANAGIHLIKVKPFMSASHQGLFPVKHVAYRDTGIRQNDEAIESLSHFAGLPQALTPILRFSLISPAMASKFINPFRVVETGLGIGIC